MDWREYMNVPQGRYSVRQTTRWLWRSWRGNRRQAALNAALGLIDVALTLAGIRAVQHAIDIASHSVSGSLYAAVAVMAAIILAGFGVRIATTWVKNILGIRAQNRMQQAMLDRILRSEWRGKARLHSGDVINRLETDVATVITFLTEVLPNILATLTLFVGAFVYLFAMDRLLAVIVVAMLPVFMLLSKVYVRRMRGLTRRVRDSDSKVQSILQETVQHHMLVKTLEQDDEMVGRLEHTHSELRQRVVTRTRFSLLSNFILSFGFAAGYVVAFLWSAVRMYNYTLTFGGMTAFLQLVNRIQTPARSLTKVVPAVVAVLTAAERLMQLEEDPLEPRGEPRHMDDTQGTGLMLDDVTFAYDDGEQPVISHLTYNFRPASCTAILGETGAGKTTLVRLLLALVRPQSGGAYIYNVRAREELSPLTRCNFVYVPQGNTLLSGTIRDNLRLGRLDATEQQMYDALTLACADFVQQLPDGLDTVCSEAGGGLSEGQAQRIAIARALLRRGSIMVFDEATSALDADTERTLLRNIINSHDGTGGDGRKTIIFVTHRPAVLDYCDGVLRL